MGFCIAAYVVDLEDVVARKPGSWEAVEGLANSLGTRLSDKGVTAFKMGWLEEIGPLYQIVFAGAPHKLRSSLGEPEAPIVGFLDRGRVAEFAADIAAESAKDDTQPLLEQVNRLVEGAGKMRAIAFVRDSLSLSVTEAKAYVERVYEPTPVGWLEKSLAKGKKLPDRNRRDVATALDTLAAWLRAASVENADILVFMH